MEIHILFDLESHSLDPSYRKNIKKYVDINMQNYLLYHYEEWQKEGNILNVHQEGND